MMISIRLGFRKQQSESPFIVVDNFPNLGLLTAFSVLE